MTRALEFRRFDGDGARGIRDTVEAIFRGAFVEDLAAEDPFDTPEAFMGRFDAYASNRQLDLIVGYLNGEPVGATWGWTLGANSRWWEGLASEPEPGFTDEDGKRTFALSEIMVIEDYTGRGFAHALHDELLRNRPEQRATLLAEPENVNAYRAYIRWGWHDVAKLRPPWPDAPLFDVLILPLPLKSVEA